jgi:F-type H+-transporting ATPase subunit b
VASLVLVGAEKILEASIDENAHSDIVNKLAANL